jgi:hypothetical protein
MSLLQKKVFLLFSLIVFPIFSSAAIVDHSDRLALAFVAQVQEYDLVLQKPGSAMSREMQYSPNTHGMVGVEVNYYGLSFALLNSNTITPTEREKKGTTRYHDYRFRFYFGDNNRFQLSAVSNSYKGLYLKDSHSFLGTPSSGPFLQWPDLKVANNGIALNYLFSPERFALPSSSIQQTTRGGSWFLRGTLEQTRIDNPTAIIPPALQSNFAEDAQFRSATYNTLGVVGGYGYNLVFSEKWLIGLLLGLGPGLQLGSYTTPTHTNKVSESVLLTHFNFSAGYNGDSFFALLFVEENTTELHVNSFDLDSKLSLIRTTIGGRF